MDSLIIIDYKISKFDISLLDFKYFPKHVVTDR